jgi:hypothetical protein
MFRSTKKKNGRVALAGVVALAAIAAPLAVGVHAAGAADGFQVTTAFNPDQEIAEVNSGNSAEWFTSFENDAEGDFGSVQAVFELIGGGSVNLAVGSVSTPTAVCPRKPCARTRRAAGAAGAPFDRSQLRSPK